LFNQPSRFSELVDEDRNEEEVRLLDNVLESDDEQADALSHEQIKRYLDESRARGKVGRQHDASDGRADDAESKASGRAVFPGPGRRNGRTAAAVDSKRPAMIQMDGPPQTKSAAHFVDEYDDLFDEELEDEPENVVVGAKLKAPVGNPGPTQIADGFSARSFSNGGDVRRQDSGGNTSLADWVDMADEDVERELWVVNARVPPGVCSEVASATSRDCAMAASQQVSVEALGVLPPLGAFASFVDRPSLAERSPMACVNGLSFSGFAASGTSGAGNLAKNTPLHDGVDRPRVGDGAMPVANLQQIDGNGIGGALVGFQIPGVEHRGDVDDEDAMLLDLGAEPKLQGPCGAGGLLLSLGTSGASVSEASTQGTAATSSTSFGESSELSHSVGGADAVDGPADALTVFDDLRNGASHRTTSGSFPPTASPKVGEAAWKPENGLNHVSIGFALDGDDA